VSADCVALEFCGPRRRERIHRSPSAVNHEHDLRDEPGVRLRSRE
jgi:hypothetical protein